VHFTIIQAIADTPSFVFLWVGDGVGLEQGRQCLKKWGFRRCEDVCWVKTNKKNATPSLRHDSHTILQHSKVVLYLTSILYAPEHLSSVFTSFFLYLACEVSLFYLSRSIA
jgi:hypothetical protein